VKTIGRWRASAVRRWRTASSAADRGYNVIEAVIIVPIIIGFTLLVVQMALLWHERHLAEAAAQAAARSAAGYNSSAEVGHADGVNYLAQVAPNLLQTPDVRVDRTAFSATVTVTAKVMAVLPFADFTVTEVAVVPVETFTN